MRKLKFMFMDVQELAQGHSVAKFLIQAVLLQRSHIKSPGIIYFLSTLKKTHKTSERNLIPRGYKMYRMENKRLSSIY